MINKSINQSLSQKGTTMINEIHRLIQTRINNNNRTSTSIIAAKKTFCRFVNIILLFAFSLSIPALTLATTKATENNSPEVSSTLSNGIKAFEAGNYAEAHSQFTSATKLDAKNAEAFRLLGMSQYKLQDNKKAIETLEKSIDMQSNNPETYYALGLAYLARTGDVNILKVRGMLKKAVRNLEQAIKIKPNHVRANFYLIQVLINAPGIMGGDEDRGLELNKHLADIAPLQHKVVNSTIAVRDEDFATAEQILLAADKQFPDKAMIAYSLGELYLKLENYSKALDYSNKFLAGQKSWDETNTTGGHYLLARIYKGLGEKAESQKYYSLVLENTNSKRMKKQVKKDLDELDGKFVPPDDDENEDQELKGLSEEENS